MKKPITVQPHLSVEALEMRYRQAKDPVARSQWQIIWLLAQGKTTKAIREVTGYCLAWIRTLAHRSNKTDQQGSATVVMTIEAAVSSSQLNCKPSSWQLWRNHLRTEGCGQVAKWPSGSSLAQGAKCIRSWAGSTSNAWAEARAYCVPDMPKLM
jgi:hypothetical protein